MEKYHEVFKDLPLPAIIITIDGDEESSNDAFIASFQSKEVTRNILNTLKNEISKIFDTHEKVAVYEKWIKTSRDVRKFYRIRMTYMLINDKSYALLIFTDITERRQHLEEITRLASIVNSCEDAIVGISLNKKILSWNQGAEHIYGYSMKKVVGTSIMKIIPQSVSRDFESYISMSANGTSFSKHETIHCHLDGHIFPVSITISPLVCDESIVGVTMVSRDISSRKYAEEQLKISHRNLKSLMYETVESLSTAHEKRDLYTAGHQRTVSLLSCCIADEMNLPLDRLEGLRVAALLHDIGKVCIPMAILAKPAKLSTEEMALMKMHSEAGYEIVKNVPFTWPVKEIILQHHERIDGTGYPHGLKGDDILLEAKILAIADVLEAMSSHRPYRPALGVDIALQELMDGAGTKYDKTACEAAMKLYYDGILRVENGKLSCS